MPHHPFADILRDQYATFAKTAAVASVIDGNGNQCQKSVSARRPPLNGDRQAARDWRAIMQRIFESIARPVGARHFVAVPASRAFVQCKTVAAVPQVLIIPAHAPHAARTSRHTPSKNVRSHHVRLPRQGRGAHRGCPQDLRPPRGRQGPGQPLAGESRRT